MLASRVGRPLAAPAKASAMGLADLGSLGMLLHVLQGCNPPRPIVFWIGGLYYNL